LLLRLQMAPLLQRHPNVQILNLRGIPSGASLLRQSLPSLTRQATFVLRKGFNALYSLMPFNLAECVSLDPAD